MRKLYSAIILIGIIAIMSPISISTVHARAPCQRVKGFFDYTWDFIIEPVPFNEKTVIYAIEYETWIGSFEGSATAVFIVIQDENGDMTVDLLSMFTGEVNGKSGGLVIRLIGNKPADEDWYGYLMTRGTIQNGFYVTIEKGALVEAS